MRYSFGRGFGKNYYEKADGLLLFNGEEVTFETYTYENQWGNYTYDPNYYEIEAIKRSSFMNEEEAVGILEKFIIECQKRFNKRTLDDWDPTLIEAAPNKWIIQLEDGSIVSTKYSIINNKSWCNRGGLELFRALSLRGHYVDCRLRGCGDMTFAL